ncbi:carboxypeptidase-like regulatory domain-containing protein [Polaribacter sp. Z014]|uniref:carboxypeptidase-like regulatory domain-containing protein n=1 Tax=Polaribacter sp. Z014 TaxID=2927126 RepID=UPI0020217A49|nr:carboxypeptidase-like regulatory domain-containing protein [Polaribacter sp. Z014]MCL7764002.1 carboxypeptidase-like regulatory domain-containing protein [Polaribacter sp. Z014]
MFKLNKYFFFFLLIGVTFSVNAQQKNLKLSGLVVDEFNEPIPYAAIGVPAKSIGTATTEEGTFFLLISKTNLVDVLEVSSIGFETFKIKIQDFLNLKEQKIVLKEAATQLDEFVLSTIKPIDYIKTTMKKLSKTTINREHKLKVLYRRFSVEDKKARLLVEHYLYVLDPGPKRGDFIGINIVAGRKSADYRFVKKKIYGHPMHVIGYRNPMRKGFRTKDYNWERTGDTSYDGEDVLIVEGRLKKNKNDFIRFYVGMDSYGIYKIETSDLKALYVYKKDADGKLVLSYHNRTRTNNIKLTDFQKKALNTKKNFITESYKHEVYVLGVETKGRDVYDCDYIRTKGDIGDLKVNYNPDFWKTFNMPPNTAFYKQSAKELESIYGVPLSEQFKLVNQ